MSTVKSHVVTTDNRQAVECEARNPCIHDHNDIKSAEGTTEVFFCRTFGALIFFAILFCRDSALRASSPAYCLSSLQDFFAMSNFQFSAFNFQLLTAHSLLFLDKALYRFTVFCNDFNEVNSAVQVCNINN